MDDERDEEKPGIVKRIIKYVVLAFIYFIIIFIIVRIWLGDYYPKEMKRLYFTDNLTSYYTESETFEVYKQVINTPYQASDDIVSFIASNLIFVPGAGELQFTLRCNDSAMRTLQTKYGLADEPEYTDGMFRFVLRDDSGNVYSTSYTEYTRKFFYNYTKLAFDGIDFSEVGQLIIDIYYSGQEDEIPFSSIYVYEDPEEYSYVRNEEYKLSKSEHP